MSDGEDDDTEEDDSLKQLTDREKKVLKMRFGIDISNNETLKDVASKFNVTRKKIREIEEKALKKIRGRKKDKDD